MHRYPLECFSALPVGASSASPSRKRTWNGPTSAAREAGPAHPFPGRQRQYADHLRRTRRHRAPRWPAAGTQTHRLRRVLRHQPGEGRHPRADGRPRARGQPPGWRTQQW